MAATFNLDGSDVPWTTTVEDRIGSGHPYTDPSIQVNLVFRITLGFISIFISFVPARLLWWNGEFAATVFCIVTAISNFIYVTNALIWSDNNVKTWWAGYGWCDLQVYIVFALQTCYNICLFEIMRRLASKVAAQRIGALTASEKRRQHIISALIIFTLPVLQVALTFFVIGRRYNVSTLAGCTAVYDSDWIFLLFFVIPSPVLISGAAVMTVVAFMHVRQIQKMASNVLHFRDDAQLARQQRVKRKLYFLTVGILLVVVPVVCFFFVANIMEGIPWTAPYDLKRIHYGPDPYNIRSITFTTTEKMGFGDLAVNYVSILSAIAVFVTFGTTPEAYNEYRKCLLFLGLGGIFPRLYEEYKPKPPSTEKSWWSSFTHSLRSQYGFGTRNHCDSRKGSLAPRTEHLSLPNNHGLGSFQPDGSSNNLAASQPLEILTQKPDFDNYNPWPDLSLEEMDAAPVRHEPTHHALRNPWKPFQLTSLPKPKPSPTNTPPTIPLANISHESQPTQPSETQPPPSVRPSTTTVYSSTIITHPTTITDNEATRWEGFSQAGPAIPPHHYPQPLDSSAWWSESSDIAGSSDISVSEASTYRRSMTPKLQAVTAVFRTPEGDVRVFTRCPACRRWGDSEDDDDDDGDGDSEAGQRVSFAGGRSDLHRSVRGEDHV